MEGFISGIYYSRGCLQVDVGSLMRRIPVRSRFIVDVLSALTLFLNQMPRLILLLVVLGICSANYASR